MLGAVEEAGELLAEFAEFLAFKVFAGVFEDVDGLAEGGDELGVLVFVGSGAEVGGKGGGGGEFGELDGDVVKGEG